MAEFQTDASHTAYRFCIHFAATTTTIWTVDFELALGKSEVARGPVVTDWESYTPTVTGYATGGLAILAGKHRRVGDSVQVRIIAEKDATAGTTTSNVTFTGPASCDSTKLQYASGNYSKVGSASVFMSGTSQEPDVSVVWSSTNTFIIHDAATNQGFRGDDFLASTRIQLDFTYPVLGWSSNQVMSSDVGGREIAARVLKSTTQSITTTDTKIDFTTKDYDTTNSFDLSTDTYTIPESGVYDYFFSALISVTSYTSSGGVYLALTKNNVTISQSCSLITASDFQQTAPLVGSAYFLKGDVLDIRVVQNVGSVFTGNIHNNSAFQDFSIAKRSSPQQIAASETVAARYTTNAGLSVAHNTWTTVVFEDLVNGFDTHGSMNVSTGVYTFGTSGKFLFNTSCMWASSTNLTSTVVEVMKNGASYARVFYQTGTSTVTFGGSCTINAVKGDTVYIRIYQADSASASHLLESGNQYNYFEITKLGV
jgi:hypothetical protein